MFAEMRRRHRLGLLVALAVLVMSFAGASSPTSASTGRAEPAASTLALVHHSKVLASLGHTVVHTLAPTGQGHRDVYAPPQESGMPAGLLLLLAAVVAASSGVVGGLGRRRLSDRAPPVLS